MKVTIGDQAPDFTLPGATGEPLRLSSLRGRKVVLFFYPRDGMPGCTAQACGLRDAYADFLAAGAQVVGISSDSVASHRRFAAAHALPFPILSDPGGALRRRYGATTAVSPLVPGRVTYLLDEHGVVRDQFSALFRATLHVSYALAWVRATGASAR